MIRQKRAKILITRTINKVGRSNALVELKHKLDRARADVEAVQETIRLLPIYAPMDRFDINDN